MLRLARRLGIDLSVNLPGWVPDEMLDRLFKSPLATICPSTYEGYGLTVAESLARSLPTVVSDIPAHREVAGEAALYFPPGDAAALADCLRRVARDEALRGERRSGGSGPSRSPRPTRPGTRSSRACDSVPACR